MRLRFNQAGFTLIEMILVISITAIVGSMLATFLAVPVQGYIAQDRRARLVDTADTALRRVGRDIRLGLPNSVRVTTVGTTTYLEFLITRTGGRYRAEGGGDILDFSVADGSFDVLGPAPVPAIQAGDKIAVYNLGIPGADAWDDETLPTSTLATFTGIAGSTISITPKQFPLASPGNRFQVVEGPVTYVCAPNAASPNLGTLTRVWGYAIQAAQPTAFPGGTQALLARQVGVCTMTYQPGITERGGLVSMTIELTMDGETVRLHSNTQVSNQP